MNKSTNKKYKTSNKLQPNTLAQFSDHLLKSYGPDFKTKNKSLAKTDPNAFAFPGPEIKLNAIKELGSVYAYVPHKLKQCEVNQKAYSNFFQHGGTNQPNQAFLAGVVAHFR